MLGFGRLRRLSGLGFSGLGIGASTPAFSPEDVSPHAWYSPSDLDTLFQDVGGTTPVTSNNDPVGYIADKSGNGKHAVRPTNDTTRPLYLSSGNWLSFDGSISALINATLTLAQPFDRFSVIRLDDHANGSWALDGGTFAEAALVQLDPSPVIGMFAGAYSCQMNAPLGEILVVREHFAGAGSSLTINGVTTAGNAGTQGITGVALGGTNTGGKPQMRIKECIITSVLSGDSLADMMDYLAGIAAA